MAGHNNNSLLIDPSLVKYHELYVHRHKHFRWTRRTAWITFTYVVVVPTIVGIMAYKTDGKWEMRGKRRGDTIAEF